MMTNNVNLVGRLTKDCSIKELKKDKYIVWFDLAFNMYYNKKDKKEKSGFIRVIGIYKNKTFPEKYLKKGLKIALSGKLMFAKNEDKKTDIYIQATNLDML